MAKKAIRRCGSEAGPAEGVFGENSNRAEKAEYIADMTAALCEMADKAGLYFLAYLLDMAHEEAKTLKERK